MKRLLVIALTVALLVVSAAAIVVHAEEVKCPIDNSSAYFTGKTKTDVSGKLLYLYKCNLYGHEFWVVQ